MNLIVRRPASSDIEQIHSLFETTLLHTFEQEAISVSISGDLEDEIEALKQTLARDFASEGDLEYFLLACDGNRVIGTVAHGPSGRFMRAHVSADHARTPEIKCLYVHPDYQGRGIGSLLIAAIVRRLQSIGTEAVCFDSGYRQAQRRWIRKFGEPTVILPDHWAPGAPHMFWYRQLDQLADWQSVK